MVPTTAQGVVSVVVATDAEILGTVEALLPTVGAIQVMDVAIPAIHLTDRVLGVKKGPLHFGRTTTALALLILVLNVSILHHNISLVGKRSSQEENWRLLV